MADAIHSTTLRPPWLHLARAAWILLAVTSVALFLTFAVRDLSEPLPRCTVPGANCSLNALSQEDAQVASQMGLSGPQLILIFRVMDWAARLGWVVVGLVIYWRKSDDWVALVLSGAVVPVLIEGGATGTGPLAFAANLVFAISTVLFSVVIFVFPNGRFVPGWMRWPALPLAVGVAILSIAAPQQVITGLATVGWLVLAIYAMLYRYRRVSSATERQQTKWVIVGFVCSFAVAPFWIVLGLYYPPAQPSSARLVFGFINAAFYFASYWAAAICFGIAILRYRLWDIDILINRALVYGGLTASLALVYFGSVVILQGLFGALSSEAANTPLVVVASTLAIAALFSPLRRRLQNFIDRRFYRRKYDAAQTLAAFGAVARDETDLDQLAGRLVQVVNETVQPRQATLWLKTPGAASSAKVDR